MKRPCFLIFLMLLLSRPSFAFDVSDIQPVAPNGVFSTFTTESLPKSRVAVEAGFERAKDPDYYRFSLKTAYGISDSIEFDMTVPYVYHYDSAVDGMEDISFGFKHRFYNEGKYGPSLAYLINAAMNNGADEFSTNGRVGIGLIVSKRVGPFSGHINLFYERPGNGSLQDEITFLGGIEFSAAHNFKMLGEILARKSYFSTKVDQVETRLGYRIKTSDHIYTTLGMGVDLKKRNPEYRILFSISYTPTPEKKEIRKIIEQE